MALAGMRWGTRKRIFVLTCYTNCTFHSSILMAGKLLAISLLLSMLAGHWQTDEGHGGSAAWRTQGK